MYSAASVEYICALVMEFVGQLCLETRDDWGLRRMSVLDYFVWFLV